MSNCKNGVTNGFSLMTKTQLVYSLRASIQIPRRLKKSIHDRRRTQRLGSLLRFVDNEIWKWRSVRYRDTIFRD